ncbi:hypothetical protein B7C51_25120 (plasmid) [Paenibacillus larvae subsp. pulvifaciens]|uniref:Uncharacterized protein n=1 Tax=Paenibacillus larvae subsp. pulvifaciens TaxID=1477 RepID=A0A1V0V025_9BACL|nr:hypothetical protein [Paenibacillus larvae]ARF70756.1 hypothetical protein B7C51_25120 [Paenibacillus larvae subsp. pulvifaciens]
MNDDMNIMDLLSESVESGYSIVDTENRFVFKDVEYMIDEELIDYKVFNKPRMISDEYNYWTNDSLMDSVYCIDSGEEIRFFNERLVEITEKIKILL